MLEPHWIMSAAMAGLGTAMIFATIRDLPALYELRLPRWLAAAMGRQAARVLIAAVGLALVGGAVWVLLQGPVRVAKHAVPRLPNLTRNSGIG